MLSLPPMSGLPKSLTYLVEHTQFWRETCREVILDTCLLPAQEMCHDALLLDLEPLLQDERWNLAAVSLTQDDSRQVTRESRIRSKSGFRQFHKTCGTSGPKRHSGLQYSQSSRTVVYETCGRQTRRPAPFGQIIASGVVVILSTVSVDTI